MQSKLVLALAAAALLIASPAPHASAQPSKTCTTYCQKTHGNGGKTYANCLRICQNRERNKKL